MPFYYFAEETRPDPLSHSLVTFSTIRKPIPITNFQLTQLSKETIAELAGITPQINTLNVGDVYYLYNGKIEGIELSGIFLKLYKVINEYRGVELNSIVVREVIPDDINGGFIDAFESGVKDNRRKFSMPPSMCRKMGIEYKPGYELWPKYIPLTKAINNNIKIPEEISDNLGEYPQDINDGSVKRIAITVNGFQQFGDEIKLPDGNRIRVHEFISGLRIASKMDIAGGGGFSYLNKNEFIPFQIYCYDGENEFCSENGEIILTIFLNRKTGGNEGINPKALENLTIRDFVNISINTMPSVTNNNDLLHEYVERCKRNNARSSGGGIWPFF